MFFKSLNAGNAENVTKPLTFKYIEIRKGHTYVSLSTVFMSVIRNKNEFKCDNLF